MADISIKKLNESFIEISAPEDISYNIYSRYSEYVAGYQFSPKYLFATASNYYSGNYVIHNAQNYVKQGQSGWFSAVDVVSGAAGVS